MSDPVEIEVKFIVEDPGSLRRRLKAIGAKTQGRVFEINYRYDDANGSFLKRRMLVRLRQDRRALLTVKLPHGNADTQFKVHRELEVEVSDIAVTDRIFSELGLRRVQTYEKWRETLRLDDTVLCIDEMPFGTFLEIEGTKASIRELAYRLGYPWDRRILANYLEIFEAVRRNAGIAAEDLTFQAFKHVEADLLPWIRRFEIGDGEQSSQDQP